MVCRRGCSAQEKDEEEEGDHFVPDPLGLNAVDLQATEAMHLSGESACSFNYP